ncbi:MAG TPA: hypothetical protein VN442_21835 [Bryobacteraceae bacterium]|nr:hypothetical protein [Bryobacteraceae bacterium]HWR37708.1 hypothetical protein [Clostridia bacterium]
MKIDDWKNELLRFAQGEDDSPLAREERERVAAALAVIDEATLDAMTEPCCHDNRG